MTSRIHKKITKEIFITAPDLNHKKSLGFYFQIIFLYIYSDAKFVE
jgi:hypothetical protein